MYVKDKSDNPIRIFVVDDHHIFRQGLVALFKHVPHIEIAGEASSGNRMLGLMEGLSVDIVILDIEMPGLDGLELAKMITKRAPHIKLMVLTSHNRSSYIRLLIKAGVKGYVLKDADQSELQEAIEKVAAGGTYYSAAVMEKVMESVRPGRTNDGPLSKREMEIIRLIAEQMTTPEIADNLHLSPKTIETHRKNILLKLRLKNVAGLVRMAIEKGWVE